jgi:CRISPR-associated protein Cmr3
MRTLTTFLRPLEWVHVGPPSSAPAGEAHHTESLFPPPATTWQGALRSALLHAVPDLRLGPTGDRDRITRLVGPPTHLPDGWQVEGPWPAGPGEQGLVPWMPVPAWLLSDSDAPDAKRAQRELATLAECDLVQPDWHSGGPDGADPEGWRPWGSRALKRPKPSHGWISVTDLLRLLSGTADGLRVKDLPPFVHRDLRPGVALKPEGNPRAGMLYFLEAHRFDEDAGLLGGVHGPLHQDIPSDALHRGTAVLGRKHRQATLHAPSPLDPAWDLYTAGAHLPDQVAAGTLVWVGLSTPALLDSDTLRHRPFFETDESSKVGVTFTVRSTLLGKDLVRGGLRIHGRGQPELVPNRPWLPAGSAWLVEVQGADPHDNARALRSLHHRCLLGPEPLRAFGAGRLMVGLLAPRWPYPPVSSSPSIGA